MMHSRLSCLLATFALLAACGSRRVAGYLEELDACSASSSETGTTKMADDSSDTSDMESSTQNSGTTTGAAETSIGTTQGNTDTTDTTNATDTSTGTPTPECGNGELEAFGPEPEECDDSNLVPDDGCGDTCALDRRVFVSSVGYQAAELQSLYLADALCANLADDQGWPDGLKYRAWLSDSTTDARNRFKRGRGRLVFVNGLVLAGSWSALLAGELQNPFEVTEKSETYHGGVWTGTRPDGTAVPGAQHCDDWTSDSILKTGHYGYADRTTPEWTLSELDDNPSACNSTYALYCMQSL